MRCPECDHRQKRKAGMTCGQCSYTYVFEPKSNDPNTLNDYQLRRLVARLSQDGYYFFTRTQLAIAICHRWSQRWFWPAAKWLFTALAMGSVILAFLYGGLMFIGLFVAMGLFVVYVMFAQYYGRRRLRQPNVTVTTDYAKAMAIIERYHEIHPFAQLADGLAFKHSQSVDTGPIDIDFAPEAILLVPRDELVDLLVRNRVHQQGKTAVISQSAYPAHIYQACQRFLAEQPELKIHCAHDGAVSGAGFGFIDVLKQEPRWQPYQDRMVDIGWARESLLAQSQRLPWIKHNQLSFSNNHAQQLSNGARVPLDFLPPVALNGMLAGAIVSSSLMALTAAAGVEWSLSYAYEHGSDDFG